MALAETAQMDLNSADTGFIDELRLLTEEVIQPEPQCNNISKYLAKVSHEKQDPKQAIVYLTNSHGLQLKNDIKHWTDMKENYSVKEIDKTAPVLDTSLMGSFNNFKEITDKIKNLPEEWTIIQITKRYIPFTVLKRSGKHADCGIFITRFTCGNLAKKIDPYYVTTASENPEENFLGILHDLFKIREDYFRSGAVCRKVKEEYMKTEEGLMKFVSALETGWLKEWRCLLSGRLKDKMLEEETRSKVNKAVQNYMKQARKKTKCSEESLDMVYQVTLSAHLMKNKEILKVLSLALHNDQLENINSMVPLMEDLKLINLENSCTVKNAKKNPVILIIDDAFELIPWEMLSTFSGQPVTRISSLHLLYAMFKYHENHIVDGYRMVKINSSYCLINPGKDLNDCEEAMTKFLKAHVPWVASDIGKAPDPKILVSKFQDYSVYFYCGHGSGMQYLTSNDLKKTPVKSLILLFGCSSNLPKNAGGRTPHHNNTYTYLTNGCPCLVGCIYGITSSDADIASQKILFSILPTVKKEDSKMVLQYPKERNVLKGVATGKMACKKYWSQSSFVVRGIPCKIEECKISDFPQSE
ncbi:UNVERIFIED_CONTAM: hypothetical protein PYX00_004033 [Menopon gallinae]|uniref:separase n=1 Tax=Menopon gallinae TaxID=328185 RepID=A0AAW2I431_9NEOP